jgi:hypothetical protein
MNKGLNVVPIFFIQNYNLVLTYFGHLVEK